MVQGGNIGTHAAVQHDMSDRAGESERWLEALQMILARPVTRNGEPAIHVSSCGE